MPCCELIVDIVQSKRKYQKLCIHNVALFSRLKWKYANFSIQLIGMKCKPGAPLIQMSGKWWVSVILCIGKQMNPFKYNICFWKFLHNLRIHCVCVKSMVRVKINLSVDALVLLCLSFFHFISLFIFFESVNWIKLVEIYSQHVRTLALTLGHFFAGTSIKPMQNSPWKCLCRYR